MTVEAHCDPMLSEPHGLRAATQILGAGRWLRTSRGMVTGASSSERLRRESWLSDPMALRRAPAANEPCFVAVVGLQFEARIIAGPAVRTVVLGAALAPLAAMLLPTDRGVISFGICGGLAPGLAAGACVIASSISDGTRTWATDEAWTQSLARSIPNAVVGPMLGVDAPILEVAAKRRLYRSHGAVAVDMESHVAALAASMHGLPFAVVRAVADDAACALLTVALAGRRADGSVNVAGVLSALRERPWDLPPLLRLALRTGSARSTLMRLRPVLALDLVTP